MKYYIGNIEEDTKNNSAFRRVLFTAKHSQLVAMSLQPGEDIGAEVHETLDQFIRVEAGKGKAVINGEETEIADDWAVVVPAGAEHNIINTGEEVMKLYTIYSPPEHRHDVVHETKAQAEQDDEHFDGTTSV